MTSILANIARAREVRERAARAAAFRAECARLRANRRAMAKAGIPDRVVSGSSLRLAMVDAIVSGEGSTR